MSYYDLISKLKALRPGEKLIYYKGFLDQARARKPKDGILILFDTAYDLAMAGRIHLIQQRIGPPIDETKKVNWKGGIGPGFLYIAVGAHPPREKVTYWAHLRSIGKAYS